MSSERVDLLEGYLDRLAVALADGRGGPPRELRRILAEVEEHLYADYESARAAGARPVEAARAAVDGFGAVATVARAWSGEARVGSAAALLVRRLAAVAGVGLLAVGVSGLLARLAVSVWGARLVFADPPGARYPAAACRYWLGLHPHAGNCAAAYLAEAVADGLTVRYAAGVLGLLVLAALAVWRRRRGPVVAPRWPLLGAAGGSALFLAAAAILGALGVDALRTAGGNGAGQWLTGAAVALPVAVGYGLVSARALRRAPVAR